MRPSGESDFTVTSSPLASFLFSMLRPLVSFKLQPVARRQRHFPLLADRYFVQVLESNRHNTVFILNHQMRVGERMQPRRVTGHEPPRVTVEDQYRVFIVRACVPFLRV